MVNHRIQFKVLETFLKLRTRRCTFLTILLINELSKSLDGYFWIQNNTP